MGESLIYVNKWLLPLSWLYGIGVALRNFLFHIGILKSRSYSLPIINIGNITVGGTGKTPHTEYLIKLLKDNYQVTVLSRGYKRCSKGYRLASSNSPVEDIGDEPWLMKWKFPSIHMAVDKSRRKGIEHICSDDKTRDTDVILLDDAYQHRYVKPGMNILLVDYNRMITDDALLPAGRLREPASEKRRADIVIITKCPHDIDETERRRLESDLRLEPHQDLYFSTLRYGSMYYLFQTDQVRPLSSISPEESVLLLTGIASPQQMLRDISCYTTNIAPLSYPDHHTFTSSDVKTINSKFASLPSPRVIVTTEKDAARLLHASGLSEDVKAALYVLPIHIEIMRNEQHMFNNKIIDYVRKNSRNSKLA